MEFFLSDLRDYIAGVSHIEIASVETTDEQLTVTFDRCDTVIEVWFAGDEVDDIEATNPHDDPHCADRAAALDEMDRFMVIDCGIVSTGAAQRMADVEFGDSYGRMSAHYRASVRI